MRSLTRQLIRITSSLVVAVAASGCGDDANSSTPDAPTGMPIEAPAEQWTWVQIDGMTCGNGSPTGVAVNLTSRSRDVVVLLNGGGACWDAQTCFTLHTAASIDSNFGQPEFNAIAASVAASPLFSRDPAAPFPDASYVFVPYCTGDVHTGHKVTTYVNAGVAHDVHHVGQDNLDALWPRLRDTRPDASTLFVTGVSAGGYGAMIESPRARAAWPDVTVHVLSDSSHPVDPEAARWAAMKAAWGVDIPADCPACANGLAAYPAYARTHAPAGSRWGLLMNTHDQVIGSFMGYTAAALETATLTVRDEMAAGTGQAAFVHDGTAHVLTASVPLPATSGGVQLSAWLKDFATGAAGWRSVGP